MAILLKKTRFTDYFIKENGLDKDGFKGWILYPGMLFNAVEKWWGDRGKRNNAHEGLDLCFYRDRRDRIFGLDENTRIPVMYDGIVVGIIDDFLGQSLIVKHHTPDNDNSEFCTIYGHTKPERGIYTGRVVKEGEVIAGVANANRSKSSVNPHVHLSIGVASKTISYDKLDWKTIGNPNTMTLVDPLQVIDRYYLAHFR